MQIEENRVYTFDEVLKILRLSPVTLRKIVRSGKIHVSKLGKQYRFLGAELRNLLEKRENLTERSWLEKLTGKRVTQVSHYDCPNFAGADSSPAEVITFADGGESVFCDLFNQGACEKCDQGFEPLSRIS